MIDNLKAAIEITQKESQKAKQLTIDVKFKKKLHYHFISFHFVI